jgi:hypothetical protein
MRGSGGELDVLESNGHNGHLGSIYAASVIQIYSGGDDMQKGIETLGGFILGSNRASLVRMREKFLDMLSMVKGTGPVDPMFRVGGWPKPVCCPGHRIQYYFDPWVPAIYRPVPNHTDCKACLCAYEIDIIDIHCNGLLDDHYL